MQGGYPPPPNAPPGGYGAPPPGGYGPPPGFTPPPGPGMMQPGAPYGVDPTTGMPLSDKSKMTAGLLQIFLGNFGIGRFYLGYTGIGVLQIFFAWMTCGLWPLIDGIMMLTGKVPDAQGRPLRE
ncbi:MAG TPA: TM2 domain-containing protein [Polyangiaceae bacterium]